MNKLMYSGSKLVFILLFTIMLPLFIKCHYVLELWLNIVPEYSVSFKRILLVQTLVVTMWSPLFVCGLATGKIKSFGLITSCLNICQIVVCYIILKCNASPVFVVSALAIWEIMAYSVQFYTLSRLTNFIYKDYLFKVELRSLLVLVISSLLSYPILMHLQNNLIMLVMGCVITSIFSILFSYLFLLDKMEKSFVKKIMIKIIKK